MGQESVKKAPETIGLLTEQELVEALLPWWSKLVHRMVIAQVNTIESKDTGEVDDVEDQRVSL